VSILRISRFGEKLTDKYLSLYCARNFIQKLYIHRQTSIKNGQNLYISLHLQFPEILKTLLDHNQFLRLNSVEKNLFIKICSSPTRWARWLRRQTSKIRICRPIEVPLPATPSGGSTRQEQGDWGQRPILKK
jgi:hypothetical protein